MDRPSRSELLAQLREIEDLLRVADVPGNVSKASTLASSIARNAPETIAARALQLLDAVNASTGSGKPLRADDIQLSKALWRLRLALQDEQTDGVTRSPRILRLSR